jgi:hypothetical protein
MQKSEPAPSADTGENNHEHRQTHRMDSRWRHHRRGRNQFAQRGQTTNRPTNRLSRSGFLSIDLNAAQHFDRDGSVYQGHEERGMLDRNVKGRSRVDRDRTDLSMPVGVRMRPATVARRATG